MKLDTKKIKMFSKIGQRATFGMSVIELAKENQSLMVLTADVSTSAGLERFKKSFPKQFLDTGIAEQNMMGIASGLASEGFDVITTTFAPFQTMRCCEQIRVNLGYMGMKVCMVGLASGISLGNLGNTHCCFEDIGVLRSIPNIDIVSPADCGETAKALFAAVSHEKSIYIRLTGKSNNPIVYNEDYDFEIGKAINLRNGEDILIIANGSMVYTALQVADILESEGISSQVINMHTIKPLDSKAINNSIYKKKLVITIEEHNIIGGLGSAVSECLSRNKYNIRQLTIGIPDSFVKIGDYSELLQDYGLTTFGILENIRNVLNNKTL